MSDDKCELQQLTRARPVRGLQVANLGTRMGSLGSVGSYRSLDTKTNTKYAIMTHFRGINKANNKSILSFLLSSSCISSCLVI